MNMMQLKKKMADGREPTADGSRQTEDSRRLAVDVHRRTTRARRQTTAYHLPPTTYCLLPTSRRGVSFDYWIYLVALILGLLAIVLFLILMGFAGDAQNKVFSFLERAFG